VVIVLGSAVSLAYYLRVVAAVWMRAPSEIPARAPRAPRPAIAGGSPEADDEDRAAGREPGAGVPATRQDRTTAVTDFGDGDAPAGSRLLHPEVGLVALVCSAATIFVGVYPEPLLNLARDAGAALQSLI